MTAFSFLLLKPTWKKSAMVATWLAQAHFLASGTSSPTWAKENNQRQRLEKRDAESCFLSCSIKMSSFCPPSAQILQDSFLPHSSLIGSFCSAAAAFRHLYGGTMWFGNHSTFSAAQCEAVITEKRKNGRNLNRWWVIWVKTLSLRQRKRVRRWIIGWFLSTSNTRGSLSGSVCCSPALFWLLMLALSLKLPPHPVASCSFKS